MVFNEISLLTGFYWLEIYKYKIRLNLETGMEKKKNWHRKRKLVKSAEFQAGSFCVGTLGWPIGCSGVQSRRQNSTPEQPIGHPKVPTQKDPAWNSADIMSFRFLCQFFFPCQFLSSALSYIYKSLTSKIPLTTRSRWTPCICFLFIIVNCREAYVLKMTKHGRNI